MSKLILPLGIDPHTHARDMKQCNMMTIMQTFLEAKQSGIGTVCLMPNTNPSIDNHDSLNEYLKLIDYAERKTGVTGYVWVALTDTNQNEVIEMLHYKKVVGVKVYPLKDDGTSITTGAVGIKKWESIEKLLKLMDENSIDKPIAGHWEDPKLGHTVESEVSALKSLVELAEEYPYNRFTACHLTSKNGIKVIEDAQKNGLQIMMEFTPHHLFFCSEQVDITSGRYKCFPPIKSCEDRKALQMFISNNKDNPLISIGSDTAPHLKKDKQSDTPPGGLATIQHIIPVMLTLQEKLKLSNSHIANLTSNNAANFLDLPKSTRNATWGLEMYNDDRVYNNGKVINPFEGELLIGKMIS